MSNLKVALAALGKGNVAAAKVVANLLSQPPVQSPQQTVVNTFTVNQQINVGTKMRIRQLPNGGVIETLGIDGLWKPALISVQP